MLGGAHPRPARPRDVPAGRHRQERRPRRGGQPRAARSPTSPTATTSASSPTATPGAGWSERLGARPGPDRRRGRRGARRARGRLRLHRRASARGCAIGRPAADGRPRYVLDIQPVTNTVVVGPAEALDVRVVTRRPAAVVRRRRPVGPVEVGVQVRAHGDDGPGGRAWPAADGSVRVELRPPVARRRGRAGRRALRRHPSARLGHRDHATQPAVGGRGARRRHRDRLAGPAPTSPRRSRWSRGELPDLPYLPELPARGPGADMIGRAAALLVELPVDLQPAGWRLVDRPGRDQARARRVLARGPGRAGRRLRRLRGPAEGAGGRAVDAGLDRLAAPR